MGTGFLSDFTHAYTDNLFYINYGTQGPTDVTEARKPSLSADFMSQVRKIFEKKLREAPPPPDPHQGGIHGNSRGEEGEQLSRRSSLENDVALPPEVLARHSENSTRQSTATTTHQVLNRSFPFQLRKTTALVTALGSELLVWPVQQLSLIHI